MRITVEPARSLADLAALISLHQEVFGPDARLSLPKLRAQASDSVMHLIARIGATSRAVGALTVMDTTDDHAIHQHYGLIFPAGTKLAHYTRPVILPEYRSSAILLALSREAVQLFVIPRGIQYLCREADAVPTSALKFPGIPEFRAERAEFGMAMSSATGCQ